MRIRMRVILRGQKMHHDPTDSIMMHTHMRTYMYGMHNTFCRNELGVIYTVYACVCMC